jgi:hypothetical protein
VICINIHRRFAWSQVQGNFTLVSPGMRPSALGDELGPFRLSSKERMALGKQMAVRNLYGETTRAVSQMRLSLIFMSRTHQELYKRALGRKSFSGLLARLRR